MPTPDCAGLTKHEVAVTQPLSGVPLTQYKYLWQRQDEDTLLPMAKPNYLPATFIIGPDGRVRDTIMGEVTASSLTQRLAQLKAL